MNRCFPMMRLRPFAQALGLVTILFALSPLSYAQDGVRNFPPAAKRGVLQAANAPAVILNGRAARLAPGARIHGTNNMLMVSGALGDQPLVVNYVMGQMGLVQEVWVLNATEAQVPMPSDMPNGNYVSAYAPESPDGAASAASPATPYNK